ncbi:MAG: hypothetical protein U0795_00580 [Pirellulales bacterium]
MKVLALMLLSVTIMVAGCRLWSNAPNPQWLTDFQRTDAILVTKKNAQVTISDPQVIDRLRNIYANAKWKPYWHTLPGYIGDQTISLFDGETKLRHFDYDGGLWETESYNENRTAQLADADRQFIESLFNEVSDGSQPHEPDNE